MENCKKYLDYRTMSDVDLEHTLRYPDFDMFDGMPYDDWLHCIKLNPTIIAYTNEPEIHLTAEVVATALSLNHYCLKFIPDYKLGYDDYVAMYNIGKMGLLYSLYEYFDINDKVVQQAIEDAKYKETMTAYQSYCIENDIVESIDGWVIFRDLYNEKRDILESVRGISEYCPYTLCRTIRDDEKILTEAFSYHNEPEKLSTIMMDIAKDIIKKHGDK